MMVLLLIVCVINTLLFTAVIIRYFFKIRAVTGFLVCTAMYDIVYGIFPLWIFFQVGIGNEEIVNICKMIDISQEGIVALIYHYVFALCGYMIICLAYYGRFGKKVNNQEYTFSRVLIDQATYLTAWTCLIVGAVSMFLWSYAYGSIFELIQQANRVRSGYGLVNNGLAFFKHPTKVLLLTTYLFFAIHIKVEKNSRLTIQKVLNYLGFVCSLVLSYFYLMANDGRLTILLFIVGLVWLYFSSGKKIKSPGRSLLFCMFLIIVALVILLKMDDITYFLRYGENPIRTSSSNVLASVAKELTFLPLGGQVSVLSVWEKKVPLTIVDDLVTGICAWLPTSMKPQGVEDVWNINTKLIYGDLSVLHGQAPCGIVTQGYYDFRLMGVCVICALLGLSLKKFDRLDQSKWSVMRYAIGAEVFLILIRCVPYFSAYDIVLGLFPIAVMALIYRMWKSILNTIKRR